MLGSITSLGERSRGRRWIITYPWFLAGSLLGGSALALSLLATREIGQLLPETVLLATGLLSTLALLAAVVLHIAPPSPSRQVDHRWLDRYRGWVIGLGFGFQLGTGAVTRISSFGLYLLLICAFLGAPSVALAAAGVGYGAIRGLSAVPAGRVRTPADLQRLTLTSTRLERPIANVTHKLETTVAALILVTLLAAAL